MASSWTQPVCDSCWTAYSIGHFGEPSRPIALRHPEVESCCICNRGTSSGIYIRVNPEWVPHPREEK